MKIDLSKIRVKFGGDNEPRDQKLIDLLKDAYSENLLVRTALIKIESIYPFSTFKPKTSEEYRKYFEELEKQGSPPPIYVYPFKDHFIMSDDYNAYYLYKEKKYSKIICVLLGDSNSVGIIEKSDLFKLPPPGVKKL